MHALSVEDKFYRNINRNKFYLGCPDTPNRIYRDLYRDKIYPQRSMRALSYLSVSINAKAISFLIPAILFLRKREYSADTPFFLSGLLTA